MNFCYTFVVNNLYQEIINILKLIYEEEKKSYLKVFEDKAEIFVSEDKKLVEITQSTISLGNNIDLFKKLRSKENNINSIDEVKLTNFLTTLKPNIIRLNHVGISYFCEDPKTEIEKYKEVLTDTDLKIYQEQSESKDEQWFFVGNTSNFEAPLCEIVLNSAINDWYKDWLPAFQVDVDTSLTIAQLERMADKYFGQGFWKWKLDIPDYGVVLAMAILGEINGVKITFGVGTNLRDIKSHRELMKELINS
jgi:hypothetical protein